MLPPGTQLGIAANELAQRGQYKPFTSDGRPTVVKTLIDQESQREAAKQAALAGQIQAQKEQEIMNAMRQMAAQQTEKAPGIAGLPADINMAEGGIVGYNGEERSDVELPVNERIKKAYLEYMAARERGEPVFRRSGVEALEDMLRGRPAPEAKRLAPEAAAVPESLGVATRQGKSGIAEQDIGELVQNLTPLRGKAPPPRQEGAPRTAPVASQPTEPGWASFLQQSLDATRAQQLPGKRTAQQNEEETRAEYIRRGIDPDYYKTRLKEIDELKAAYAQDEAEREKIVAQRGLENVLSGVMAMSGAPTLARGLAGAGKGVEALVEKQRLSDAEFRKLRIDRQKAINDASAAVQQFREARALGDIEKARASEKDFIEAFNKQKASEAQLFGGILSPMIQTESSERVAALNRAAQEKIAGMQSVPAEIKLLEWMRDPRNKKLYEEAQSLKREDDRMAKLYEVYTKNKMQLGDMSFEEFVAGFKVGAGATGAMTAPPAGAVREKSKG